MQVAHLDELSRHVLAAWQADGDVLRAGRYDLKHVGIAYALSEQFPHPGGVGASEGVHVLRVAEIAAHGPLRCKCRLIVGNFVVGILVHVAPRLALRAVGTVHLVAAVLTRYEDCQGAEEVGGAHGSADGGLGHGCSLHGDVSGCADVHLSAGCVHLSVVGVDDQAGAEAGPRAADVGAAGHGIGVVEVGVGWWRCRYCGRRSVGVEQVAEGGVYEVLAGDEAAELGKEGEESLCDDYAVVLGALPHLAAARHVGCRGLCCVGVQIPVVAVDAELLVPLVRVEYHGYLVIVDGVVLSLPLTHGIE